MNKIYLVVSKLIDQPTWGGRYILENKGWTDKPLFSKIKIGQSYELFSEIKLRADINSSEDPSFVGELGYAMEEKTFYNGDKSKLIPINRLIKQNPLLFLGKTVLAKHGPQIKILIKFTQAKGNSFQLHVRQKDASKKWHFKAESWYYFEPGLLTLGVKETTNWDAYQTCCLQIEEEMKKLSNTVLGKKITLNDAKLQAKIIVKKYNPWQYVNLVKVKQDDLVDLSRAGLHHSWEEDENNYPLGNVLYEMCLDVMDPISTVRCFDNGKIQDDGRVRELNIKDYFKYIDRSKEENNPANHLIKPVSLINSPHLKVDSLLKTKYYCLEKLTITENYKGEFTQLNGSFHHLFVKEGMVNISSTTNTVLLSRGHSCFIPCGVGSYKIKCVDKKEATLLKTFVS